MIKRNFEENRYNYFLFGIVILLLCIGLVMVYSASHHVALKKYEDGSLFFRKHFYRVLAGLIVMAITALIPYKMWLSTAKFWLLLGIGLLAAVLIFGESHGTATRWIKIYGFQFQPVDFVRLAIIFYLTDAMVRKQEYLDDWKVGILPQFIVLGLVSVLLLKQPDMGSVVILFTIGTVIFLTAGVPFLHIGTILTLGVVAAPFFLKQYQWIRIKNYFDSIFHDLPLSYQVQQSLISLGNGGLIGQGLDNSTQKLEFLPEPFTDFIFAIVGEEFGFLGALILLTLFLLIVMEGYRIAYKCRDEGGAILATGITTSLALYAFLNAGVVCNLFPTKGLPMPLISYGGSFMISSLAGIGILLNISQHNEFRLAGKKRRRSERR
ncbi:MAG TPA: cell division protein FtsW [Bacteroidetes bacterium]|nr:cell division protein FtsW [Bacteroidota bacterium]